MEKTLKNLCLLGSTGYIGTNSLEVVKENPDRYNIVALGAGRNIELLSRQIRDFKPPCAAVIDSGLAVELKKLLGNSASVDILYGIEGYREIVTLSEVDTVISGMSGFSGLIPTFSAVTAGKNIALANKESLVIAGGLLMDESRKRGVNIIPIDSEHSAIQQALKGHSKKDLKRIILTASGGPFKDLPSEKLAKVTPEQALKHPRWQMGRKISIDSATMMNKGMETIEAKWLFDVELDQINILLHPESIIHSMVEYIDGSIIAQLSLTDMRIPISYALSHPRHINGGLPSLDLSSIGTLNFERPDKKRFRCLDLALSAGKTGGSMPAVLNGANEMAVQAFLDGKIGFMNIPNIIEDVMQEHQIFPVNSIEAAVEADSWAKSMAEKQLKKAAGS